MSTDKNAAEKYMQGKNQFARFRIIQTEVGEHLFLCVCHLYCLVMLTFRTEVLNADMLMILLVTHSVAAGVILCLL